MGDREGLLASIIAHPGEDVPRLAFADFLEEHAGSLPCPECRGTGWERPDTELCGECMGSGRGRSNGFAERAEFIRCQVACSRHTDCPVRLADLKSGRPVPLRCGACDYCRARRRAEELSHRFPLLPPSVPAYGFHLDPSPLDGDVPPVGGGLTVVVSRGFVSAVYCTAADWLRHGRDICREQPVAAVTLTDREPFVTHGGWGEWVDSLSDRHPYSFVDSVPHYLPSTLFCLLPEDGRVDEHELVTVYAYRDPATADTALSAACIRWARATSS